MIKTQASKSKLVGQGEIRKKDGSVVKFDLKADTELTKEEFDKLFNKEEKR